MAPMVSPSPISRGPGQDLGDLGTAENTRGDRSSRKQFGPDAKPARNRSQKFKPEGGKKAFKEKFTGQIFGADDGEEVASDSEIDNFATGAGEDDEE